MFVSTLSTKMSNFQTQPTNAGSYPITVQPNLIYSVTPNTSSSYMTPPAHQIQAGPSVTAHHPTQFQIIICIAVSTVVYSQIQPHSGTDTFPSQIPPNNYTSFYTPPPHPLQIPPNNYTSFYTPPPHPLQIQSYASSSPPN